MAIDNDYATWRSFNNQYWPALYFADAKGRIRRHRFGEGEHERSETVVQQLLRDAGTRGVAEDLVSINARGVEVAADWRNLQTQLSRFSVPDRFASDLSMDDGRAWRS